MAYLPELHYCQICSVYLGPNNGDGICAACDQEDEGDDEQGYYDEVAYYEA